VTSEPVERHCVIIPFYNRLPLVERCLELLLAHAYQSTQILLIDDGSAPPPSSSPSLCRLTEDERVTMIRLDVNRGVAAARNVALRWCRRAGIDIVLMLDSDCEPPANFLETHLRLHREHPEAACIGCAVEGTGGGFWAKLDGVTMLVHALPTSGAYEVKHPYHLGTTNFSAKLERLPDREKVFNELLCTGEDALLIREMRRLGHRSFFFPTPLVIHRMRETFRGLLWHHYQYGQHHYFVQLGGDFSPRCFKLWYRVLFVVGFLFALPFFAVAGSVLCLGPWLRHRPHYVLYYPFVLLLWTAKGIAVLQSAVAPRSALRAPRDAEVRGAPVTGEPDTPSRPSSP